MTENAYIPSSGLTGKLKRMQARLFERDPIHIAPEQLVVSITFDDFPKSAVESGAAELEKRGWRGTWYAAAGFAGTGTHHGPMFDQSDIQRLEEAGHEIACHTLNHIDLGQASAEGTLAQINANRDALKALGQKSGLPAFAYPYGEASPVSKRILAQHFETLRGVRPGINRTGDDRNLLKAVGIDGGESGLATAKAFVDEGTTRPGWLIFYAHDIQDQPTEWGCTPGQFRDLLDHVQKSGANVLPVTEAYRALTSS
ncbi:polysaccharide deacetylase family protein [Hyphobacterium sp.]|uniref:polysaccharide deacetylase family protein n=1 Tax=Hyphobacterium sp. TaxID=2004662 RepID=UPI0037483BF5